LPAFATRLGIGSLVVGSVRRAGSRLRITVELMRVSDNSTLWSQTFAGDETSLFAVQDSIAHAIATALQARLADTHSARGGLAGRPISQRTICTYKAGFYSEIPNIPRVERFRYSSRLSTPIRCSPVPTQDSATRWRASPTS